MATVEMEYAVDWDANDFSGLYTAATEDDFAKAETIIVRQKPEVTAPTKLPTFWGLSECVNVEYIGPGAYMEKDGYVCLLFGRKQVRLLRVFPRGSWTFSNWSI